MAFIDVLGGVGQSLSETSFQRQQQRDLLERISAESAARERLDLQRFERERSLLQRRADVDSDIESDESTGLSLAELPKKQRVAAGFNEFLRGQRPAQQRKLRAIATVRDQERREERREQGDALVETIRKGEGALGDENTQGPLSLVSKKGRRPGLRSLRREATRLAGELESVGAGLETEKLGREVAAAERAEERLGLERIRTFKPPVQVNITPSTELNALNQDLRRIEDQIPSPLTMEGQMQRRRIEAIEGGPAQLEQLEEQRENILRRRQDVINGVDADATMRSESIPGALDSVLEARAQSFAALIREDPSRASTIFSQIPLVPGIGENNAALLRQRLEVLTGVSSSGGVLELSTEIR